MKAKDIMTTGVISIDRDASVEDVMKKMFERRVTSLIVNKQKDDDNVGIVTRKDIINAVIAENRDPTKMKVEDIMSEPLLSVSPDFSIENLSRLMSKTNLRRFPVVEGDRIIGVVSNSDIIRAVTIEHME
ncbi:MAG: CBS domain-containing protein [Candidatus Altiarchaeota archaeon]|nr:CBS domain-containing protein [Candidatus Altiarchaeota archaeon]